MILKKQVSLLKDSVDNRVHSYSNIAQVALNNAQDDDSAHGTSSLDSNTTDNNVIDEEGINRASTISVKSEVLGTTPLPSMMDHIVLMSNTLLSISLKFKDE